ncbi:unnamed protein product, partial [Nesidiocoris tenuis]
MKWIKVKTLFLKFSKKITNKNHNKFSRISAGVIYGRVVRRMRIFTNFASSSANDMVKRKEGNNFYASFFGDPEWQPSMNVPPVVREIRNSHAGFPRGRCNFPAGRHVFWSSDRK